MHLCHFIRLTGSRFTIIIKVKEYLRFKVANFTLRKTIFLSYPESQFLRDPAENVHGVVIKSILIKYILFLLAFIYT